MSQYYTVITDIGQAKLANATALGETVELTAIAVGDGGGELPVPESDVEALVNQQRSASINQVSVDPDNANYIVCEQVIPEDVGGWWIREVGIFDVEGDLIAYGNFPETYKPQLEEGSGRTQTIRVVIMISDTSAVTLKVDPSVVLATRDYVDSERAEHEASRNHPAATTAAKGFVELATQAEVDAEADNTRAVTPGRLAKHLLGKVTTYSPVNAIDTGTDAYQFELGTDIPANAEIRLLVGSANVTASPTGENTDGGPAGALSIIDVAGNAWAGMLEPRVHRFLYNGAQLVLMDPSHQRQMAQAWVKFDPAGAISDSYNVSSITDNGVGDWTINLATPFSNADYVALASSGATGGSDNRATGTKDLTANSYRVEIAKADGSNTDPGTGDPIMSAAFGVQ